MGCWMGVSYRVARVGDGASGRNLLADERASAQLTLAPCLWTEIVNKLKVFPAPPLQGKLVPIGVTHTPCAEGHTVRVIEDIVGRDGNGGSKCQKGGLDRDHGRNERGFESEMSFLRCQWLVVCVVYFGQNRYTCTEAAARGREREVAGDTAAVYLHEASRIHFSQQLPYQTASGIGPKGGPLEEANKKLNSQLVSDLGRPENARRDGQDRQLQLHKTKQ